MCVSFQGLELFHVSLVGMDLKILRYTSHFLSRKVEKQKYCFSSFRNQRFISRIVLQYTNQMNGSQIFIFFRCSRSSELMNKRTICFIHKCRILLPEKKTKLKETHSLKNMLKESKASF